MTNNVGNNDATNTAAISSSKQTPAVESAESEVANAIRCSTSELSLASSTTTAVKFNDTIEIHTIPRIDNEQLEELYYLQDDIETFQYEVHQYAIEIQTAIQHGIPVNDDDQLACITGQFQSVLMR